jgi:hypothetical protein
MRRFTVRYALVRGPATDRSERISAVFGGGRIRVSAPDRPGAYEAALGQLPRDRFPIFAAPRVGGAPLGFSEEEVRQVADRGLPFSDLAPPGDAIKIESIEPVVEPPGE